MQSQTEKSSCLLPIRKIADRFDVSVRTVHRWVNQGIVPKPQRIRGRNYLPADTEPRRDVEAA